MVFWNGWRHTDGMNRVVGEEAFEVIFLQLFRALWGSKSYVCFLSLPIVLMADLFIRRPSHALIVDCSFMTGTKVNLNGDWLKVCDYMSLLDVITDKIGLKY